MHDAYCLLPFTSYYHPQTKGKKRTTYRSKITTPDIKKAYRKQAQLYHPDKATRHNMTTAEATSRFAEIAEAYQTLVDTQSRYEYDWELLEMEDEYEDERLFLEEEEKLQRRRDQQYQQQSYEQQQQYNSASAHDYGDNAYYDASSLYEKIRNGASNFNTWKDNIDPWAVFEDFFFQDYTAQMGGGSSSYSNTEEYYSYQQHSQHPNQNNDRSQSHHHHHHNMIPPRISETTIHRGYDPRFGAEVYTVLRREEYIHNDTNDRGQYYYQMYGQDFVSGERLDPYTGIIMQQYYSAVTEPYFVEEGWASPTDFVGNDDSYTAPYFQHRQEESGQRRDEESRQSLQKRISSSKLKEGESFTPASSLDYPWISANGKYRAILTSSCELQIVTNEGNDEQQNDTRNDEDNNNAQHITWSSETYIPSAQAHGCYLSLNSLGRLVLSVDYGSSIMNSVGNSVLWNTPVPPVIPHWNVCDESSNQKQQPVTFQYYASLDNDGVIAVYRVRERIDDGSGASKAEKSSTTQRGSNKNDKGLQSKLHIRSIIDKLGGVYHHVSEASAQQGQTKAAFAWDHIRYRVIRTLASSSRPNASSTQQQDSEHNDGGYSRHECIFSTSPVGCLAPGRTALHLTKKLKQSFTQGVKTLDTQLDHFISVLTDPVESYYDSDSDDYNHFGYSSTNSAGDGYFFSSKQLDDDDEDILDTLLRVTGAAGVQLGKVGMRGAQVGMHGAQVGMKHGKKVAGKVVGKMKKMMVDDKEDDIDFF